MLTVGTLSLAVGIIGIFLPLIPTTPLLLLAAACYVRSSERFYTWLMNHKVLGPYIKNYQEGRGMPFRAKAITIALLWITILSTAIFFIDILFVRVILLIIAICVTYHLVSIPTYHRDAVAESA